LSAATCIRNGYALKVPLVKLHVAPTSVLFTTVKGDVSVLK